MNTRSLLSWIGLAAVSLSLAAAPVAPAARPSFHPGAAPRPEFKVGGRSYKIDPESGSAKQIRALPPDRFDPIARRGRVADFYRDVAKPKDRPDAHHRDRPWHCGRYRPEFIYWVEGWRPDWWARWGWHHRAYLDEALWDDWMRDRAFAAEVAALRQANAAVDPDYMPPPYAGTSPVVVYADEYIDAVYNPPPVVAVLPPKGLRADPASDWISAATADSLLSDLSAIPGLFVADEGQVNAAVRAGKLSAADAADPSRAAQIGRAVAVERVVTGSYAVDGPQVLFNLRVVNVKTGTVENGVSRAVPRDHLVDGMPGLAAAVATLLGYPPPAVEPAATVEPPPSMTVDQRLAAAPPPRRVLTAADALAGTASYTADEGLYEIQDTLPEAQGAKNCVLRIGPGADVRGGTISGSGSLHVDIAGTADRPAILRHVAFQQTYGGDFRARYAVFDDCTFRKTGAWYAKAGFTSKWDFAHCVLRGGEPFRRITHVDYGVRFRDCAFVGATLPEIVVQSPKGQPLDYMAVLRKDWRVFDHCSFDGCVVPQTVFWCATASDYDRCRFPAGPAFESDTPTEIVAFVAHPDGDGPDRVAATTRPTRAPLHVVCATQPFRVDPLGAPPAP